MAQKFSSPGTYLTEIDQSFLTEGAPSVGATVVGRTLKGPAMVPVVVGGFSEFANKFGSLDVNHMLPYAANNYLKNSNSLTVVRVLGHADGTAATNGYTVGGVSAITDQSGTDGQVRAVIHHSGTVAVVSVTGVALDANNFILTIGSLFSATASFVTSSANYVGKVLNTDPTKYDTYGHYLYSVFPYVVAPVSAAWTVASGTSGLTSFARDFEGGVSAYVKSQPLGGLEFNLFRFNSVAHGKSTNNEVKVVISNVKPSLVPSIIPYGTFDVTVRAFDDTDQRPEVLESFIGCTMDPNSANYIARKIGDVVESFSTSQRKFTAAGTYPRKSNHITVEMVTTENAPPQALPWGHRGYKKLAFGSTLGTKTIPTPTYVQTLTDKNGNFDDNIVWGLPFVSGGIADRMHAEPNSAAAYLSSDTDFSLSYLTGSYNSSGQLRYAYAVASGALHQPIYSSASLYKFALPLAGGFDGFDLRVTDPLYLGNADADTVIGVTSTKRALDAVANPDIFVMDILAVPGIHNLKVTDKARSIVNDRKDVMLVMDITGSTVTEAIQNLNAREIDDNYTATYYPDLKLNDRLNNRIVRVAPSVGVLGALSYSDRVSQPWFAPAGLSRGGLKQFDIIDAVDRLDGDDRGQLYDARINPITSFPNEGIVIFGQKTLQARPSALDRVNVRRLLIFAKRAVGAVARSLVFDPNDSESWDRFTKSVNPILKRVQQDRGLTQFKVVMDNTTNTADVIDRNIMQGKIFLQPTKAAEFIAIDFIVTASGVSFAQ